MSKLDDAKMPSLKDKILAQAEEEARLALEEAKKPKEEVVITKKTKKK